MIARQDPVDRPVRGMIGGLLLVASLAGATASVAAQSPTMTVNEFLAKENTARAAGAAAESPEVQAMRAELARATAAYRADLAMRREDGSPPHSCPPPKGQAGLTSTDVLKYFRALPAEDGDVSVKDGFYAMMQARYPCVAVF